MASNLFKQLSEKCGMLQYTKKKKNDDTLLQTITFDVQKSWPLRLTKNGQKNTKKYSTLAIFRV